jgi:hypothetical protein
VAIGLHDPVTGVYHDDVGRDVFEENLKLFAPSFE